MDRRTTQAVQAATLLCGLLLVGCRPQVKPATAVAGKEREPSNPPADRRDDNPSGKQSAAGVDWTAALNAKHQRLGADTLAQREPELPEADFRAGHAKPLDFEGGEVTQTEQGFAIQLPSASPVPTPMIHQGRLYVSGGFSCKEYYCFDAATGKFIWGAKLDDDGPSSAVPYNDSILFGCESCTLFALAADSGKLRWAHWLGDPLMSMPTVASGMVFTVYPAGHGLGGALGAEVDNPAEHADDDSGHEEADPPGTESHIAACFDADSGRLLWRRWIDSDCLSAPVAAGGKVYITSLAGTVYAIDQTDGRVQWRDHLQATSAPVISGQRMIITRRADADDEIAECVALQSLASGKTQFVAARQSAPYLDAEIQRGAVYSLEAGKFESANGIGGGFGGGFGFGGQQSVPDEIEGKLALVTETESEPATELDEQQQPQQAASQPEIGTQQQIGGDQAIGDPLVRTQQQAIDNVGLGNVSTLQSFHGSRVLLWSDRMFSCMGDKLVAVSKQNGRTLWEHKIDGDLQKTGGHLASPPIAAGSYLLITTVGGEVQQIDPERGTVVHRYQVDAELRFPPIVHRGRIYVTTQDGRVLCIVTNDESLTGWPMWGRDAARSNKVAVGEHP